MIRYTQTPTKEQQERDLFSLKLNKLQQNIKYYCTTQDHIYGQHLKCFVTTFALENNIDVDTYKWDLMIYTLWSNIPQLREDFDDKDNFDFYVGEYLS